MLQQTLTTQPFQYRTPAEIAASGITGAEAYNPQLLVPPRIYGEVDYGSLGLMFLNQESTVDGFEVIYLWLAESMVFYPGYLAVMFRFNATTGDYLNVIYPGLPGAALPANLLMSQALDGTLWMIVNPGGGIYQVSVDPVKGLAVNAAPSYQLATYVGMIDYSAMCVITDQDTILFGDSSNQLRVYDLTTGVLQRSVAVPDAVAQVMANDQDLCYVVCLNGVIALVDFTLGVVQSVFRILPPFDRFRLVIAWDSTYRRFLGYSDSPINIDATGQNLSVIVGYYPVPIATNIMAPIPLKPPRKFRTTPVLTRLYGDVGEPIGGTTVAFVSSDTTLATFAGYPALTDGDGEAIAQMTDLGAGSVTVTVTTNVTQAISTGTTLPAVAATPNFIASQGIAFTGTQTITMGTTTIGASIYYTTDGTTPTTASTLYATPITISGTITLNAIAHLNGITDSPVESQTYTLLTSSVVLPSAPTVGTLTAGAGQVSLTFTPGADGGTAIESFKVTLSTGQSNTGTVSPIAVTCPNGIPVTATVTETTAFGTSLPSAVSNPATPAAAALTALWPDPLPSATQGIAYSFTLTASGGVPPYTYGLAGGYTLPAGLSLNASTGEISGTPSATVSMEAESFTVTDSE